MRRMNVKVKILLFFVKNTISKVKTNKARLTLMNGTMRSQSDSIFSQKVIIPCERKTK